MPEIRTKDSVMQIKAKEPETRSKAKNIIAPKIEGAIREEVQDHRNKNEASNEYAVSVTEETAVETIISIRQYSDKNAKPFSSFQKSQRSDKENNLLIPSEEDGHYSNSYHSTPPDHQQEDRRCLQEEKKESIKTKEFQDSPNQQYGPREAKIKISENKTVKTQNSTQRKTNQTTATKAAADYGYNKFKHEAQKKAAETSKQAAKKSVEWSKNAGQSIVRAVKSVVNFIVKTFGVVGLVVSILVVLMIGIIASSPLGILFSNEPSTGAVPLSSAVAQINMELNRRLNTLQTGNYTGVEIIGAPPSWLEVVAVFASYTAGAEGGVDVASLTPDRVSRLTSVFWQMCFITSSTRTVTIPDSNPDDDIDDSKTETYLTISILAKSADEMRIIYGFTEFQNMALDTLLSPEVNLSQLISSVTIDDAFALELLKALPANLSPDRRAVVQQALSLVGKVNYFWGGKSLVLGWDPRWGQLTKVWAAGSSSTGTYRPYGLDCSGFVDWVFYNVSGGSYVIGQGGGAEAQHWSCTPISWGAAQPGDLVFYPNDDHIGIVGGKSETGHLLIIHCASGQNNVVITDSSGFVTIARPNYYNE